MMAQQPNQKARGWCREKSREEDKAGGSRRKDRRDPTHVPVAAGQLRAGRPVRGQRKGPGELAVSALHLVVVLAGDAGVAPSVQGEAAVVHADADLVARQAGQFSGDDERLGGLAQVHGRGPAMRSGGREPLDAVLDGDQVAEGIPAGKRHTAS